MKPFTFIIILSLLSTKCAAQAQSESECDSSSLAGGLLWKISGNGLSQESYLFGTFHLIESDFMNEVPGLNEALEKSAQVGVERDLGDLLKPRPADAYAIPKYAYMPDSTNYEDIFKNRKEFLYVDSFMIATNRRFYKRVKPLYWSQQLQIIKVYKKMINEKRFSLGKAIIDVGIYQKAKDMHKELFFMETHEELKEIVKEIGAFPYSIVDLDTQAHGLYLACKKDIISDSLDIIAKRIKLYRQQNLKDYSDLEKFGLTEKELSDNPELSAKLYDLFEKRLTQDRNKKWLSIIESNIRKASSFMAVGVGHLIGENGLITLLRKDGYTVKPVLKK